MKRSLLWFVYTATLSLFMVALPKKDATAQPGMVVSFQMFYDELSPYGQWIDDPQYGYVWAPDVGPDFRPYYSRGRWMMTNYGNTWVSDYDWGWAPFHYGRWTYDNWYGWLWIPGDQWGPAWVTWRQGGGYYGWAPMGPGIQINMRFGNHHAPFDWWTFIPYGNFFSPNWHSYWRGPRHNTTIINQTTIINNYYENRYVYGPRRRDLERHVGRVNVYELRESNNPGRAAVRRNEVALYRPQMTRNERRTEAPRQVVRAERGDRNRRAEDRREQMSGATKIDRAQPDGAVQVTPDRRDNTPSRLQPDRAIGREPIREQRTMPVQQNNRQMDRKADDQVRQQQQEMQRRQQEQDVRTQQRSEEENRMRKQREMSAQKETERRRMAEQQRAAQENARRMEMEASRQQQQREQEMRNRQQMEQQRQQQIQQQREQQQRMQMNRQPAQQREWHRPNPPSQPQRLENRPAERANPNPDGGKRF